MISPLGIPTASVPTVPAGPAAKAAPRPEPPPLDTYAPQPALVAWGLTAKVQSVPQMFRESVAKNPDGDYLGRPVGDTYRYLTYRETQDRVHAFASRLVALGLRPGDRVATFSDNRPEWPITDLGTMHAGAVHAPLYFNLAEDSVEYILRDSGARVVVVDTEAKLKKVLAVESRLPSLEHIVVMEPTKLTSTKDLVSFDDFIAAGRASLGANLPEIDRRVAAQHATDVCSMVYTSGTTGEPKGVLLAHGNFLSNVEGARQVIDASSQDVQLSFLPLAHALERAVFYSMTSSAAAVAYPDSIGHFARDLSRVRPTIVAGAPLLLEKLFEKAQRKAEKAGPVVNPWKVGAPVGALVGAGLGAFGGPVGVALGAVLGGLGGQRLAAHLTGGRLFDWSARVGKTYHETSQRGASLGTRVRHFVARQLVGRKTKPGLEEGTGGRVRLMISGGAPLRGEVAGFLLDNGFKVSEGYGLSETSPIIAVNPPDRPRIGTVGVAIPWVEIRIADDGEILARGPNVMNGYLNKPQDTAATVDAEGWLHTGDIGTLDGDGYLTITDRKKNLLVLSTGKKVAPQPIENLIKASPYVQEAVVVGNNQTRVGALLVPDFEALAAWAKQHGIPTEPAAIAGNPEVRKLLSSECARLTEHLDSYERVSTVGILDHELTVDAGELTPTMKVKRKAVGEKYAGLIDGMFGGESDG